MTVNARALAALSLVAALAAAPAHADAPTPPRLPPPAPEPPPAGAERVEVRVTFPPWQYTGKFRLETISGDLLDEGTARDDGGFASQATVERVLEGARGTLVLRVQRTAKVPRFPALFGRWTVVGGTGAYARAVGRGTFTSCASGEVGKGSPFELQTLVGYARLR
nr:hypothetical protein [Anaeromyxobacter sp. SG29]